MNTQIEKHRCTEENASRFVDWITNRGGLFIWGSLDLRRAGQTWSTPAKDKDGKTVTKPHWACTDEPIQHITSLDDVKVDIPKEVKRFYVAVRMGSQGMSLKLTDGATRRVNRTLAKLGDDAWYEFDYSTQEAVFYMPGSSMTLRMWVEFYNVK